MPFIIGMVVGAILVAGGFLGGRASVDREQVTYEDVLHETHIDIRQEQNQDAVQSQVTVIIDGESTNRIVSVNVLNLTNVVVFCSTNTNRHESYTNRQHINHREAESLHETNISR